MTVHIFFFKAEESEKRRLKSWNLAFGTFTCHILCRPMTDLKNLVTCDSVEEDLTELWHPTSNADHFFYPSTKSVLSTKKNVSRYNPSWTGCNGSLWGYDKICRLRECEWGVRRLSDFPLWRLKYYKYHRHKRRRKDWRRTSASASTL